MKNALIDPNETPVEYISGWTTDTPPVAILTSIENSWRVAQVQDTTFGVASPLFWTECADDVEADKFYYNSLDNTIYPCPPSPAYPPSGN